MDRVRWPLIAPFGDNELITLSLGLVSPVVVLFLLFQRYFVAGFSRSGLR